jgi:hypothetical protein
MLIYIRWTPLAPFEVGPQFQGVQRKLTEREWTMSYAGYLYRFKSIQSKPNTWLEHSYEPGVTLERTAEIVKKQEDHSGAWFSVDFCLPADEYSPELKIRASEYARGIFLKEHPAAHITE